MHSFLVTSSALLEKGLRWLDFSFILFQLNEGPLLDGSTSGFHSSPADSYSGISSALAGPDSFDLRALGNTELSMGERAEEGSSW